MAMTEPTTTGLAAPATLGPVEGPEGPEGPEGLGEDAPVRPRTAFVGRLEIQWDPRILEPRPWVAEQSRWAALLLTDLPPGPVLELCSGAGHIGLLAVAGTRRELVCVDVDPVASRYAADNARRNGLADQVSVRTETIADAAEHPTAYSLVLADPPWVSSHEVTRFPEDPVRAIDGGADGSALAVDCVRTAGRVLAPGGALVLQVGDEAQLDGPVAAAGAEHGLVEVERRVYERGVLALLRRPGDGPGDGGDAGGGAVSG